MGVERLPGGSSRTRNVRQEKQLEIEDQFQIQTCPWYSGDGHATF